MNQGKIISVHYFKDYRDTGEWRHETSGDEKLQNFQFFGKFFLSCRENVTKNTEANREESKDIKEKAFFDDII